MKTIIFLLMLSQISLASYPINGLYQDCSNKDFEACNFIEKQCDQDDGESCGAMAGLLWEIDERDLAAKFMWKSCKLGYDKACETFTAGP